MNIQASELILNPDNSIYHLNVKCENLSPIIFLVGDPKRVQEVSQHFDTLEFTTEKREFVTHTGSFKGKRLSVVSTGIGTDNIDIALNELDAVFNIDFDKRLPCSSHTRLTFIRLGTSGALQPEIPVDSIVLSSHGLGMDNMLHAYRDASLVFELPMQQAFLSHTGWASQKGLPYIVAGSSELQKLFFSEKTFMGITGTASGFYGPQGRVLRLAVEDASLNDKLQSFRFEGHKITNLEMETSAIYGLSKLLGHRALSMNAIIANRANGSFSKDYKQAVKQLIAYALDKVIHLDA